MFTAADKKYFFSNDFITSNKRISVEMSLVVLVIVLSKLTGVRSMEPFIVGGEPASTEYYSYSAFLHIETAGFNFACGSSIVNQKVILSAAHCFEDAAEGSNSVITIRAGSASKLKGAVRSASAVTVHRDYDEETVENDIALVFLKDPLVLGTFIKRIILMQNPPKAKMAIVAGWGMIDEHRNIFSDWLQRAEQRVWTRNECRDVLHRVPKGCICGGSIHSTHYAAQGDSGSALIINDYIQIGLVSHKKPEISISLVVYTDVAYHYDWIRHNIEHFYCSDESGDY